MTASPKKRTVRPAQRPSADPKPGSASSRRNALTDATEDIGDLFEETLLEVLAPQDGLGWKAGPVVAIPMSRLAAGHLGWTATLSAPGATTAGTIQLLVVPGSSSRPPKDLPLSDATWSEFDSVDHFPGPPRLLLLARARTPATRSGIRQLTHTLFAHLRTELGSSRS
ncbi:MAG: hypothetical protein L3K17_01220 [Thermoplasmata archaeon]|nr:hypothetical protein [Thermoplasmata archaeon]